MVAYRRKPTIRLPEFDYSSDGLYFLTTCVHDRVCHFGHVVDDQMQLNAYGEIVQRQWFWLLERYPYLESHAFQVMPNHVHAVLEINRGLIAEKNLKIAENQDSNTAVGTGRDLSLQQGGMIPNDHDGVAFDHQTASGISMNQGDLPEKDRKTSENQDSNTVVGTGRDLSLPQGGTPFVESQLSEQPIKIKPLDQLLGAYKTTSSKLIHEIGLLDFRWQRSYHDHIIRTDDSYDRIIEYILSNPARWCDDEFYVP